MSEPTLVDAVEQRIQELEAALRPFARLAEEYDGRVYPFDNDSQFVGARLGDLRQARLVLAGGHPYCELQALRGMGEEG